MLALSVNMLYNITIIIQRAKVVYMIERTIEVKCVGGLHARPAKMLADTASRFSSEITLCSGEIEGNAKSLLSILMLGISQNSSVTLRIFGADEGKALLAIMKLIDNNFVDSEAF